MNEESDGYLYIQGVKITNNQEGIRTIYSNIYYSADRNVELGYVDSKFVIDENGYVICLYHTYSDNKVERWVDKFMNGRLF